MTGRLDDQQQRFAAQVEADHQDWVIMWGYHSRLYWAFPRFNAPPGTVVAAPATAELTEGMRRAELAAAMEPRFGPAPPARPRRPEPLPGQARPRPPSPRPPSPGPPSPRQPPSSHPPRQTPAGRSPADPAVAGQERRAAGGLQEPEANVG